jgi:hypothetical protein
VGQRRTGCSAGSTARTPSTLRTTTRATSLRARSARVLAGPAPAGEGVEGEPAQLVRGRPVRGAQAGGGGRVVAAEQPAGLLDVAALITRLLAGVARWTSDTGQ